jgi:hypothetical protein
MMRNIYLKFEEETLQSKEVIIFLKESSKGDKSENIASIVIKYDKQDQQGKAAFNERNPHNASLVR